MRYTNTQVLLHWITALLVVAMIATGALYSNDIGDDLPINIHQIVGQALIVVLILRLLVRSRHKAPPPNPSHQRWERALSGVVHFALYLALIVFVASGYVSASAFSESLLALPVDIGFARSDTGELILEVHFLMKFILAALLLLHIAGALKHAFVDRDKTLSRMWFSSSNRKDL